MEVTEGESSSTQASTSYKEVLTVIKMAIVPENFPTSKITEEQSDTIQEALVGKFRPLEGGEYPQFANFYTEKGAFILSCANNKTKKWLNTILPKLQPWQDAKLKVGERKDILQTTRVMFKTLKEFAKTDPSKVLEMLGKQNTQLDVTDWQVITPTKTTPMDKL
jgi:DNA phosphorothioation-dependent restriction protein DptG